MSTIATNSSSVEFREKKVKQFSKITTGSNVNSDCQYKTRNSAKNDGFRMLRNGKEIICLVALILTAFAAILNKPFRVERISCPKSYFPKTSLVEDWPGGQLDVLQVRVSSSELSLVFFYAPWCAESEFAKNIYEEVADIFQEEVYFAAVNCWHPSGECRLQYSKVNAWPVLMAYYQGGAAVQYTGQWTLLSLKSFVESLISPIHRLTGIFSLLRSRAENNAVITGFFKNIKSDMFSLYLKTALNWLEEDPLQDLKFTVVTGDTIEDFNITHYPSVKLYLWNETVTYPESIWSLQNISSWIKKTVRHKNQWVNVPGKKSFRLTNYLKDSPSVLIFTPREYMARNNPEYFLVKQVAWEYSSGTSLDTRNQDGRFILLQGAEMMRRLKQLRLQCLTNKADSLESERRGCYIEIDNTTESIVNIMGSNRHALENVCPIGYYRDCIRKGDLNISMINSQADVRSAKNLLKIFKKRLCGTIESASAKISSIQHFNESVPSLNDIGSYNNTLSFLMLDSILYQDILQRLDVGTIKIPRKTTVFIVDNKSESTYKLDESLSFSSFHKFIENFHERNLSRKLREKKLSPKFTTFSASKVGISEVNFSTINDMVEFSNATLVILFFSSQCALCSLISQSCLKMSKILKSLNINFMRIDGDDHDFPWQYAMESYPTLIIAPPHKKFETRVFPENMEVSDKNIFGFILANLPLTERLQALAEFCDTIKTYTACQSCLSITRKETLRSIQINLRFWRHNPFLRTKIVKRLEILQKAYMQLFKVKNICDTRHFKILVVNLKTGSYRLSYE